MALEHRFLQLLELPTSAATSKIFLSQKIQDKLFPGGHIHGVVRPDLPEVHPFFKFVSARVATGEKKRPKLGTTMGTPSAASSLEIIGQMESSVQNASCWRVQTVAAQMRSRKDVCRHLLTSAQTVNASGYGGALLLVSGGHPLRRLPVVDRFLPSNSLDMLRTASQLRKFGNISPGVQLWAVENPLLNSVARLEQKIEAGAETVILQPPLLIDRFGEWWGAARSRG
ncbi:hypothetical protein AXG93_2798s1020 [Marchantia polymorpha subsp. ruderalis]|uniref:Uncharacterized protein n=1 Tax=Marchantia polymorpha subsp. ruderalis TaxID=1480154 RepID=A0A176VU54_MARPO|nr:hypothetical protein AXG93_2798s1020 [Marchantia polymorpha subsp. ruderalis]